MRGACVSTPPLLALNLKKQDLAHLHYAGDDAGRPSAATDLMQANS